MRKLLIAGNWKMFKTAPEAAQLAGALRSVLSDVTQVDIMVAPPFTALGIVGEALRGSPVALGAQNLFWAPEGAYTGEISGPMLKAAGCSYVIIGHSERRQYFGENDESVNRRIAAALRSDLKPVVCVGETEPEREGGKTFAVIEGQLSAGLKGLTSQDIERLTIAYEPVWAIGTGKTATSDQAQEVHRFIREQLDSAYGNSIAKNLRILYGGSVKADNAAALMGMADIDGALVGGASLKADSFAGIVRNSATVAKP